MYAQDFIRLRQSIRARLRSELLHPSAQMLARDRFIVHTPCSRRYLKRSPPC